MVKVEQNLAPVLKRDENNELDMLHNDGHAGNENWKLRIPFFSHYGRITSPFKMLKDLVSICESYTRGPLRWVVQFSQSSFQTN